MAAIAQFEDVLAPAHTTFAASVTALRQAVGECVQLANEVIAHLRTVEAAGIPAARAGAAAMRDAAALVDAAVDTALASAGTLQDEAHVLVANTVLHALSDREVPPWTPSVLLPGRRLEATVPALLAVNPALPPLATSLPSQAMAMNSEAVPRGAPVINTRL